MSEQLPPGWHPGRAGIGYVREPRSCSTIEEVLAIEAEMTAPARREERIAVLRELAAELLQEAYEEWPEPGSPEDADADYNRGGRETAARLAEEYAHRAGNMGSVRLNHLTWNGTEWVDSRCGCRYHPDDDNGSHGGAPHVHRCEQHTSRANALEKEPPP